MNKTKHVIYHNQPILVFKEEAHPDFIIGYAEITGFLGVPQHPTALVVHPNWNIEDNGKKWHVQSLAKPLIIPAADVDCSHELIGRHEYDDIHVNIHRRKFLYTGSDKKIIILFWQELLECRAAIRSENF